MCVAIATESKALLTMQQRVVEAQPTSPLGIHISLASHLRSSRETKGVIYVYQLLRERRGLGSLSVNVMTVIVPQLRGT